MAEGRRVLSMHLPHLLITRTAAPAGHPPPVGSAAPWEEQ